MSTFSVLYSACIFFREFCNFGQFHKIKYTQNFLFKGICKTRYMRSMQKNSYLPKINTQKKYAQKMLVNAALFLESINNSSFSIFHLIIFLLILTEKLATYPLNQMSFSYSFFFGVEIYKLKIFKNLPFAKISTREIRSVLACKNKYMRKLVHLKVCNGSI